MADQTSTSSPLEVPLHGGVRSIKSNSEGELYVLSEAVAEFAVQRGRLRRYAVHSCPIVCAQTSSNNPITVTPAASAGYTYSNLKYHILPAMTSAGQMALAAQRLGTFATTTAQATSTIASVPAPGFYPDDLDYFGGPVVTSLRSHPVYLNAGSCGGVAKCWGKSREVPD
jgi:hypothetical protein